VLWDLGEVSQPLGRRVFKARPGLFAIKVLRGKFKTYRSQSSKRFREHLHPWLCPRLNNTLVSVYVTHESVKHTMGQAAGESEPGRPNVVEELDDILLLLGGLGDNSDKDDELVHYEG
jgi:hypothetical protein